MLEKFGNFSPDARISEEEAEKASARKMALELETRRAKMQAQLAEAIEEETTEEEREAAIRESQERLDQKAA